MMWHFLAEVDSGPRVQERLSCGLALSTVPPCFGQTTLCVWRFVDFVEIQAPFLG